MRLKHDLYDKNKLKTEATNVIKTRVGRRQDNEESRCGDCKVVKVGISKRVGAQCHKTMC